MSFRWTGGSGIASLGHTRASQRLIQHGRAKIDGTYLHGEALVPLGERLCRTRPAPANGAGRCFWAGGCGSWRRPAGTDFCSGQGARNRRGGS